MHGHRSSANKKGIRTPISPCAWVYTYTTLVRHGATIQSQHSHRDRRRPSASLPAPLNLSHKSGRPDRKSTSTWQTAEHESRETESMLRSRSDIDLPRPQTALYNVLRRASSSAGQSTRGPTAAHTTCSPPSDSAPLPTAAARMLAASHPNLKLSGGMTPVVTCSSYSSATVRTLPSIR